MTNRTDEELAAMREWDAIITASGRPHKKRSYLSVKESVHKYYMEHREQRKEYRKIYNQTHREQIAAQKRKLYEKKKGLTA